MSILKPTQLQQQKMNNNTLRLDQEHLIQPQHQHQQDQHYCTQYQNAIQQQDPYYHEGKIRKLCGGYYSNPQRIYLLIFIAVIFGCTYIFAAVLAILMITQVFIFGYHAYIGRILCVYIMYRYLSLALSNPGLTRQKPPIKPVENHRFCKICSFYVRKFTRHCQICDVCVDGYDHHCIFIGKCIGVDNLGQFKEFLCVIFCTLGYAIIVSLIFVGGNGANIRKVGDIGEPGGAVDVGGD